MEFYRNYEVKRITIRLLIMYLVFCFFIYFYTGYRVEKLSQAIIKQNTGVVGTILDKHPDLEEDLIKCYTKDMPEEVLNRGRKILNSYGYGIKTSWQKNLVVKGFKNEFSTNIIVLMTIFFFITMAIVMMEYKYMLKKIRRISNASEKVIEKDFSVKLVEGKEGEFNILAHQFNQMSNIIENSIDNLKKEKEFLKDIISDISHQLKTPLSSLMIFNELFIEGGMEEEEKINFYYESRSQLQRMEWLIKNLLKIAKIEAKAIEFEKNYNPLNFTVKKALEPLKIKWQEKNQKVIVNIEKNITFKHDVNWTSEAITNIVKNCIEHTKELGEISIRAYENPICISLTIKDNGSGISKEDLPHIFERFYKGKRNSNSVGIGLALSKSIIESQGGSITAKSVEGEGSEFIITFLKGTI